MTLVMSHAVLEADHEQHARKSAAFRADLPDARRGLILDAMRVAPLVLLVLVWAVPVAAAPTCEGRQGQAMRCGTPGAMPLGWRAPVADRQLPGADRRDVFVALAGIVLLFALIALLPEFDGSRAEDWEPEDGKSDPYSGLR
jgi:hypothetical protein